MNIRALIIATALSSGVAFAAAPNNTAKAPADTDAKSSVQKTTKQHKKMARKHHAEHHAKHHARHHAMKGDHRDMVSSTPQTNVDDQGRQARMDEALAKYRQQRG
jgi:hypothetical protein